MTAAWRPWSGTTTAATRGGDTMIDEKPRRSRIAWSAPGTPDLEKSSTTPLRRFDKLLLLAVVALLLAVGTLTFFVYQQQLYIEGRGEYRDREAARIKLENAENLR